jgi:hypothetical protein
MTLEDALGRPILDLQDAVFARVLFSPVKHGPLDNYEIHERYDFAYNTVNKMSNMEFLENLSIALEDLKERKTI